MQYRHPKNVLVTSVEEREKVGCFFLGGGGPSELFKVSRIPVINSRYTVSFSFS